MVHSVKPLVRSFVYAFVVVTLAVSTGLLAPKRGTSVVPTSNLFSGRLFYEEVDNCSLVIQEKYECEEEGCTDQANYINYLYLQNCSDPKWSIPLSIIWVFVLILLLCLLASTADQYFCVVMDSVVGKLHIPPSIAGVTFLAFGNGAPDVFSLIVSVISGMTEIGVGANLGAGLFVTTVVAGCISVVSVAKVNKRAFLRDSIYYLICVIYLTCVFFDKQIKLWEAIGFIILYILYVIVIVLFFSHSQIVMLPKKKKKQPENAPLLTVDITASDTKTKDLQAMLLSPGSPSTDGKQGTGMQIAAVVEAKIREKEVETILEELVVKEKEVVNEPVAVEEKSSFNHKSVKELWQNAYRGFRERKLLSKLDYIMEYPFTILRDISCPLVDDERWNKYWILASSVVSPFLFVFLAGIDITSSLLHCPLWIWLTGIAILLLLMNCFLTSFDAPPTGFALVIDVLIGFVMSVIWISAIANELVSLLNAMGLMLNISNVILGLTILAWGNSLGDVVADTSIAKQGYPQMAIGGVFAAPMFNLLIGMGSALIIGCGKTGVTTLGKDTASINLTFIFLFISILSSIIFVPIKKFTFTKGFGIYLFCLYGVFMVLSILVATKVITLPFITPK